MCRKEAGYVASGQDEAEIDKIKPCGSGTSHVLKTFPIRVEAIQRRPCACFFTSFFTFSNWWSVMQRGSPSSGTCAVLSRIEQ